MPAVRTAVQQNDFSEGMNRDVAPELIPERAAYDIVNGLLDEDGGPYRRGGTAYLTSEGFGEKGQTWLWDGYLLPGHRTVCANESDFGVLSSGDNEILNLGGAGLKLPKQFGVLSDLLYIGGGTLYGGSRMKAVYSTGTVSVNKGSKVVKGSGVTWNTLVDAGMLFHIGTERVYVVESIKSSSELLLRDNYEGTGGNEKIYTLNPVWEIGNSDPYEIYDYVTVCANRFVFLSGRTIKFTEVDNPHSFTNSLGTTNEHTLPKGTEGVGLTTVGQTVLPFTTAGVWMLDGLALSIVDQNGNPQHRLQELSSDTVLAGAPGLTGSGQQMVVPAVDGIFLMDGISQPERVSRPIDRLYRRYVEEGYVLGQARVFRSHYLLPVLNSSGDVKDLLVCRLDRPVRSRSQTVFPWSRLAGDGASVRAFATRSGTTSREPELFGAQASAPSRVLNCSAYFEPDSAHKNDADGSTHYLEIITRDYETGGETENAIRALRTRYLLTRASKSDNPVLRFWRSEGTSTGAKWGAVKWGSFKWAGPGAFFTELTPEGEVSDGRGVHKCRVNTRARFQRFRLKTEGPCSTCVIRNLEVFIRPSQARRR